MNHFCVLYQPQNPGTLNKNLRRVFRLIQLASRRINLPYLNQIINDLLLNKHTMKNRLKAMVFSKLGGNVMQFTAKYVVF
jgi:hypothetical protein